jgi:hypothetical protein
MRRDSKRRRGAGVSVAVEGTMTNARVEKVLWWLGLVVAPLVLLSIELFHPSNFTHGDKIYDYLSVPHSYDPTHYALAYPGPDWWFVMHMIQTPLVGLVAVGLWLLVGKVDDNDGAIAMALAWLSRAFTFVFLIYYTALDTIGGTGLGRLILNTQSLAASAPPDPHLDPHQVDGVKLLLDRTWIDPWVGGVGSFFSLTGSWAVFIACVFAAAALLLAKKMSVLPLIVLLLFGWQLQVSHASPNGPIAFALLVVAGVWMWWAPGRTARLKSS